MAIFLSHVLRNFIEDVTGVKAGNVAQIIPEPCAQELHGGKRMRYEAPLNTSDS